MAISELYHLFVSSLKMMACRGYSVEEYRNIIDLYETVMDMKKNNFTIPNDLVLKCRNKEVFLAVRYIMSGNYKYKNPSTDTADNFTFAVTNYETGDKCIVTYFKHGESNFLANDFTKIIKNIGSFSSENTGDSDFCRPNSGISGIIILNGKIGTNPKEKIKKIENINYMSHSVILSKPYNNVLQSQHCYISPEKVDNFIAENMLPKDKLPSISLQKDIFSQFMDVKRVSIDETFRYKFSDEDPLDVSIQYRRIK